MRTYINYNSLFSIIISIWLLFVLLTACNYNKCAFANNATDLSKSYEKFVDSVVHLHFLNTISINRNINYNKDTLKASMKRYLKENGFENIDSMSIDKLASKCFQEIYASSNDILSDNAKKFLCGPIGYLEYFHFRMIFAKESETKNAFNSAIWLSINYLKACGIQWDKHYYNWFNDFCSRREIKPRSSLTSTKYIVSPPRRIIIHRNFAIFK